MADQKRYLMRIPCGYPDIEGSVFMGTATWEHIQDRHSEVDFPDVYDTVQNPKAVHQDVTKKNGLLFVGCRVMADTNHPVRVAVKTGLPDGNFVQTAFYSSDPIAGKMLWEQDDGGGDDK
ncbi:MULTISPECIES: hypothetical protein [unclassified Acetobacter]|nr:MULTISPECIES: hypothetical protein [unclassified Acetobacter]